MPTAKKGKAQPAKKIPLSDIIREEEMNTQREEMGQDPVFDPDRDLGSQFSGPRAFQSTVRDHDQLVLDELLASLPKNQGYYLKLYREVLPGKFEYKESIEHYDTWTDMEREVAEYVKAMTRKFGSKKWGSGLYRLLIWRQGGIRERNKYPAIDVIVDAGDNEETTSHMHTGKVDPAEAANEQLHALGNMLSAVEKVMPKAVDPNVQFQAIVQAFTAGKEEKREAARNDSNQMVTMMTTMMTSMMTLVTSMMQQRNTGAGESKPFEEQMAKMMEIMKGFGFGSPSPQKTLVEQITEMKMLGWDPTVKEDTIEQIAKLKAMTGALVDVLPSNGRAPDRPGIFERLVDSLAPHVPKIFSDIRSISENAALAQQMQQLRLQQAPQAPQEPVTPQENRPRTRYGQPVGPQPNRMGAGDAFHEPVDMDPYSGFQMRPFQDRTESDAGTERQSGGVDGATAEELRQRYEARQAEKREAQSPQPVEAQLRAQAEAQEPARMPPMLQQLYVLITQNVTEAYGGLFDALSTSQETLALIEGVRKKEIDGDGLLGELRKTGFPELQTPQFVLAGKRYLSGFVEWVLENTVEKVYALCPLCSVEHIFDCRYEFDKSDHVCGIEKGGKEVCEGGLCLVTHAER